MENNERVRFAPLSASNCKGVTQ